ncbi:hypothetical protein [Paraburkholderia tropica]|uniref:hypothetical protein n=1 Tax=Paraburkholderia tropica TaxID=92647 RepID=UPI002AB743CF|nr:hypothetical protein [Paraburkholderia tropica]
MCYLLLTRIEDGSKELVNMALVSEAISLPGESAYTTLVVPSAVSEEARYIAVSETPQEIAALLASQI